ncbi:MAG: hypothetical protein EP344_12430 [Bacteroidetes bacterium]|nr:MAG: hypothetical protein EP344_12430 [Bacteroidota bacterium]
MQKLNSYPPFCLFLCLAIFSCNTPDKSGSPEKSNRTDTLATRPVPGAPIGEFVVEVYEDSRGNLWFGTVSKGVARYDGKNLTYFTTENGLAGNTVASIREDKAGNIWLGTHSGLSRYNGKSFTNFTGIDGLCDNRVSAVLIDRAGTIWIGTWGGACRFNGVTFSDFPLPTPDVEILPYQTTMDWVTELLEDAHGNIWICRDGYGVCKYDGTTFTSFSKKDGLPSNNVQAIAEDRQGNIWFGSRIAERDNPDAAARTGAGGLSRYDGQSIRQFPDTKGLSKTEIYAINTDRAGQVWIGANGLGLYRFDGEHFTLYSKTDRKDLMPYGYGIQSILEDRKGAIWLGLSGGLFRLQDSTIVHVAQDGPWE